jgi:hypothetical protein
MQGNKRSKARRDALLLLAGVFFAGTLFGGLVGAVIVAADKPEAIPVFVERPQPAAPTAEEEDEPAPATVEVFTPDPDEVELIGRTIWGEAGGVKSEAERAAVAWCILNRVDAWNKTVEDVVTAPMQFLGYRPTGECPQAHLDLAADVLTRWNAEKEGATDVGRTLPADYLYFYGDGERNHFSIEWRSGIYWRWTLTSPYITK